MASEPGQNGGDSTSTIGYSDASDTTEAGDAVGITGGEIGRASCRERVLTDV